MSKDTCKNESSDNSLNNSDSKQSNTLNELSKVINNLVIIDDNIETINLDFDDLNESDYIDLSINTFIKFKETFRKYNIYLSICDNNNDSSKYTLKGEGLYNLVNSCNNDIETVSNILKLITMDIDKLRKWHNIFKMNGYFIDLCLNSNYEISDIIDYCRVLRTFDLDNLHDKYYRIYYHFTKDQILKAFEFGRYLFYYISHRVDDTHDLLEWVENISNQKFDNDNDKFEKYIKHELLPYKFDYKYYFRNVYRFIDVHRFMSKYEDFTELDIFINDLII